MAEDANEVSNGVMKRGRFIISRIIILYTTIKQQW